MGRNADYAGGVILTMIAVLIFITPAWPLGFAFLIPAIVLFYLGYIWAPELTVKVDPTLAGTLSGPTPPMAVVRVDQGIGEENPTSLSVLYVQPSAPDGVAKVGTSSVAPLTRKSGNGRGVPPREGQPSVVLMRCSYCGRMFDITLGKCPSCGAGV